MLLQLSILFSVDELLLVCALADISVGVFLRRGEVLKYNACYIGSDMGASLIPICLEVDSPDADQPRGHFQPCRTRGKRCGFERAFETTGGSRTG